MLDRFLFREYFGWSPLLFEAGLEKNKNRTSFFKGTGLVGETPIVASSVAGPRLVVLFFFGRHGRTKRNAERQD